MSMKKPQKIAAVNKCTGMSRRDFLKVGAATGLALVAGKPPCAVLAEAAEEGKETKGVPWKEGDDILLRMQDDLSRALTKPETKRKWAMAIDIRKCIGCFGCTVSCIAENKLPTGVVYRPVIEEAFGNYPDVVRRFWPRPCFHCDNPPCVPVCPVKATHKREDGIVSVDYDKCIGCRYCITACPYGARYSDFGEFYNAPPQPYEELPSFEYGEPRRRKKKKSPVGNARKCHFCLHLLKKGILPRCVSSCVGRATYFGDVNDKEGLIYQLSNRPNIVRLKEHLGTRPSVWYLI